MTVGADGAWRIFVNVMAMRRKMRILSAVVAFLLLFLLGPAFVDLLRNARAYQTKTGQVVDADSGAPISGAYVVASAAFDVRHPIEGGSHGILYRHIVRTDANGTYVIPSEWTHAFFTFSPWGGRSSIRWVVTALQPGYAVVGDEKAWESDAKQQTPYPPASVFNPPKVQGGLLTVHIAPIQLKARNLSPREATIYYSKIVGALGWDDLASRFLPEEVALRHVLYDLFVPLVCEQTKTTCSTGGRLCLPTTRLPHSRTSSVENRPTGQPHPAIPFWLTRPPVIFAS